jgi:hypothetical protein
VPFLLFVIILSVWRVLSVSVSGCGVISVCVGVVMFGFLATTTKEEEIIK